MSWVEFTSFRRLDVCIFATALWLTGRVLSSTYKRWCRVVCWSKVLTVQDPPHSVVTDLNRTRWLSSEPNLVLVIIIYREIWFIQL